MTQIKICPACLTEYFQHIESCADCGSLLVSPEETKIEQMEEKQSIDNDLANSVVVREGSSKWINELLNVLVDSNIPCGINTDAGCNKGCCGDTYRLMVSSQYFEKARERIEKYCMEIHPEIKVSKDLISQGKCPACGSPVGSDAVECQECGLILLIVEKE